MVDRFSSLDSAVKTSRRNTDAGISALDTATGNFAMRTQSVWLKAFVALSFGPVAVTLGILGLYDMVIGFDPRALIPMATFSFALGLLFGGFFSAACALVVVPILILCRKVSMLAAMATGALACALSFAFVVLFDAAPVIALVSLVADTLLAIGLWVIFRIWQHEN